MFPTRAQYAKKNLLLCFDAFGTLFQPNTPIPRAYAQAAIKHGVKCNTKDPVSDVGREFKRAFKDASRRNPNYGKATGLGPEKWWRNVIQGTFQPWLEPGQDVPQSLVDELLRRYSTKVGYDIFPDVVPFFQMLKQKSSSDAVKSWPWEKTVVGIITNSDDRVPGILNSFGLKIGPRRVGTPDQRSVDAIAEDDISFVVLSYDVGVEKPDRGMFDAAVDSMKDTLSGRDDGLQIEDFEKLYVGDSLNDDYNGARGAGWNALMLDRNSNHEDAFAVEGKDLIYAKVKVGDSYAKVHMVRNLEALKDWSITETSP
ncbi:haloacid dehalogenase [Boeremia exigua]|uniref:haloacid dehalogenase n=1 Tax=Boeremia exigua TaxID=749465 RepID=UPI001E8E4A63|nr:haloacid dehalogenase [Boeremia exigua]KAH6616607.1 haloacid dehalogenase [Boeremia exigua]